VILRYEPDKHVSFPVLLLVEPADVSSCTASGSRLVMLGLMWVSKPCNLLQFTSDLSLENLVVVCFGHKLLSQTFL